MLKALRWLSSEAAVIPDIKGAGAITELVPLLNRDKEPEGPQLQKEALHALYNICQFNRQQHLEVAASANVVPHLCRIGVECLNEREAGGSARAAGAGAGAGCRCFPGGSLPGPCLADSLPQGGMVLASSAASACCQRLWLV